MKTTVKHAISAILATAVILVAPAMARADDSSAAVDTAQWDASAPSAQQVDHESDHPGDGAHRTRGRGSRHRHHHHCVESLAGVNHGDAGVGGCIHV